MFRLKAFVAGQSVAVADGVVCTLGDEVLAQCRKPIAKGVMQRRLPRQCLRIDGDASTET